MSIVPGDGGFQHSILMSVTDSNMLSSLLQRCSLSRWQCDLSTLASEIREIATVSSLAQIVTRASKTAISSDWI